MTIADMFTGLGDPETKQALDNVYSAEANDLTDILDQRDRDYCIAALRSR
jgi:hypothetical protein